MQKLLILLLSFFVVMRKHPAKTQFLLDAEEAGATILNGLGMSLYQGAAQIEYWTGQEPPIEAMRPKLLDIISEK